MLSRTVLAHTQSCVIVASPADDQIQAVVLHPHDDLLDQHANNTFARGYGRPLRMPSALDVGAEPDQRLAFAWAYAIRGHYAEGIELVGCRRTGAALERALEMRSDGSRIVNAVFVGDQRADE